MVESYADIPCCFCGRGCSEDTDKSQLYYSTEAEADHEIKSGIARMQMIALRIEHIKGKLVNEK